MEEKKERERDFIFQNSQMNQKYLQMMLQALYIELKLH